jgi:hypothetical protein
MAIFAEFVVNRNSARTISEEETKKQQSFRGWRGCLISIMRNGNGTQKAQEAALVGLEIEVIRAGGV